ncbi:MAG: LysM peptidoglycan-binding domain-containing protein [Conexibacter sp.]
MAARGPARILAPLALIASLLGVIVVIAISGVDSPTAGEPLAPVTQQTTQTSSPATPKRDAYTVKAGDNLTVIAEKTGVSVETIERLNPDLDPQALQTGTRLKLVP